MNTLHLTDNEKDIKTAAAVIKDGGLVAMPTETVYGLAANALDGAAVRRIFEAKGRPMDNPLIVHIADVRDVDRLGLVSKFPEKARRLAMVFWPGPLTIIMQKGRAIPDEVSAGLDTVAIRLPSHPAARELIRESELPLAAPSANTSGKPSPTTAQHVIDDMDGRIDAVIDGGACSVGVESTVITLATDTPRILRPGIVTREEIEEVIGPVEVDKAVLNQLEKNERASSPGMKYKHYAPRAKVILVRSSDEKYVALVNRCYRRDGNCAALCYAEDVAAVTAPAVSLGSKTDLKQQAQALFDALRAVDELDGVEIVYAHCPTAEGVGMALYNRLIRAAAFQVIELPEKRIIGLTGQTGAGKSAVAAMLSDLGAGVVSADIAARQAVEEPDVKAALCAAFGDVLNPDRSLNRARVARAAFSSKKNLQRLNEITHPRIVAIMLETASRSNRDIVIFDAPQLFEAHADIYCEKIISVLSDREKRIDRLVRRDHLRREEVELRMSAQYDEQFFISRSDSIINNNGSVEALRDRVAEVFRSL